MPPPKVRGNVTIGYRQAGNSNIGAAAVSDVEDAGSRFRASPHSQQRRARTDNRQAFVDQ